MSPIKKIPSVFEYQDYRRFLEDYFAARRSVDDKFSIRGFTLQAGLPVSNSSYFSKVIAGKRNLTLDLQYKIAKAMKLGSSGIKYFGLLVRFNQSKDPEAKSHLFQELAKQSKSKARTLTKESLEYYARWQYSILRAFFGINQKEKNPGSIGKRIFPPISAQEVEEGIKLLLALGLITKTANGYVPSEANIGVERENRDLVGKSRILEMLRLALEVFPRLPPESRDFSALTVYISKAGFEGLQEKIRTFREDVKVLVSEDKDEDRIYTLSLQLFPNNVLPEWGQDSGSPRS